MPFAPTRHTMEIIELEPGLVAPEGEYWINVSPVIGGDWTLDGNLPQPCDIVGPFGPYRLKHEAIEAGIAHALKQGVARLWIEFDARRCD